VAIAFVAQYIAVGTQRVESRVNMRLPLWIGLGLLLALASGLGALAFGYPFLTTHTLHAVLPLIGEFHFASATFFDAGVFAVVVGTTLLLLTALAHQSMRSRRRSPQAAAPGDEDAGAA